MFVVLAIAFAPIAWSQDRPTDVSAPPVALFFGIGGSPLVVGDQVDVITGLVETEGLRAASGLSGVGAFSSLELRLSGTRFFGRCVGIEAVGALGRKRILVHSPEVSSAFPPAAFNQVAVLRYQVLGTGLVLRRWRPATYSGMEAFGGVRYTFQSWLPEARVLFDDTTLRRPRPAPGWYGGVRWYRLKPGQLSMSPRGLQVEFHWETTTLRDSGTSFGASSVVVSVLVG